MKTFLRQLFATAALTFAVALASASAEPTADKSASPATSAPAPATTDKSAATVPAEPSSAAPAPAPAAPVPAVETPAPTPPAAPAEAAPAATTTVEPTPASAEPMAEKPASAEPTADKPAPKAPEEPKLRRLDEEPSTPATPADRKALRKALRAHRHNTGNEIVNVGSDSFLAKDHKADAVVSVFGSSTSEGEVSDSVVSIFGNTRVTGPTGDAAVSVFGNTYVNSKVGDSAVAVFGNVELGPDAEVNDVVAVGGKVTRNPKAIVHGQVNNVSFGGHFSDFGWLQNWIMTCAVYLRPLAFAPGLMWAWWIALGFLAFYVVVALLFPGGVNKGVDTLVQRPGYSILTALLTVLLVPIVMILLAITGIGIAVIPFLAVALFVAALFGKVVMLAWIGRRLAKLLGADSPALAVLIGGVIMLLIYTIPFAGFIAYKLLGWIGLGVAVYTVLLGMKREKPAVPPAPPVVPPAPGVPASGDAAATALLAPVPPVAVSPAATLTRAGFWIRTAALLLDVILVAIVCSLLNDVVTFGSHLHVRSGLLPALAVYGAVMWKLKGTTVGGIVCGLKVVRLDDRPIDWGTAIVRALGCFLSLIVMGLGFLWVVFDDQRQSWHDKIAGTTVVRVPKGVSLV